MEVWHVWSSVTPEGSDSTSELLAHLSFVLSFVCLLLLCLGSKTQDFWSSLSPGDVIKNVAVKLLFCLFFCFHSLIYLLKGKAALGWITVAAEKHQRAVNNQS